MSINASTIQILLDGSMGGEEILTVAKAMERGEDRDAIFSLVGSLEEVDCPRPAMAIAILNVAEQIIEINSRAPVRMPRRDAHSCQRDSNKSRRGLSNKRWQQIRCEVFERDGWACVYCGSEDDLTCDHVIPLVRGGTNDNENLATACRSCNSSKGDKLLCEWERRA